jgi:hypothetical protein
MNATANHLVLDGTAGERLIAALSEQIVLVDGWISRARELARPLPLGANPVGTAMADKFSQRADSGDGSLVAVLERYRAVLEQARAAAGDSMRLYRDVERHDAGNFGQIAG